MRRENVLATALAVGLLAMGSAFALAQPGERAAAAHTEVNVTTGSTAVLAAAGSQSPRKAVTLVNASDTDIWCAIGTTAVVGKGLYLATSASSPHKALWLNHQYPLAAINCIHAGSGNKSVAVTEWR